ncbi:MAG: carbohydrate-binding domain-containing protein, partial [Clostridia bacterium]|nr:carbohydrate-binding domain-containing protein [Clostridia bacterium]
EKTDKVQLVLDGVSITSATSAALYIRQADKVFLTLAAGSENRLANGGSFAAIDENNIDAVIFARDDLTLNGTGALVIDSPAGHGVAAKDELVIAGGSYTVTAAGHGFSANDSICLSGAVLNVTAGKDGLKAEHDEDALLGYIVVERGEVTVTADGDGLSASAYLQIADGEFDLTTGGGHKTVSQSSGGDWSWGFGGRGGRDFGQNTQTASDTTSAKGIKAGGDLLISGGRFIIDAADDALHSNANLTVSGGELTLASGDDGIHADAATVIAGGIIDITASYEGLEGLSVTVSGGETAIVASDDGINAAGGADSSGFGGFFGGGFGGGMPGRSGGDSFTEGGEGDIFILISGGRLTVNAGGDGIDSNGKVVVRGGETYVAGPTSGANGALDYDGTAAISGGIFIAVGASGMAQNFSAAENQGAVMVNVSGAAGSEILLTDAADTELFRWTAPKSYGTVVLSCPGLVQGGSYTLTCGGSTCEIKLDQLISGGGFGGMGGGGFGGNRPNFGGGGNPGGQGGRGGRP